MLLRSIVRVQRPLAATAATKPAAVWCARPFAAATAIGSTATHSFSSPSSSATAAATITPRCRERLRFYNEPTGHGITISKDGYTATFAPNAAADGNLGNSNGAPLISSRGRAYLSGVPGQRVTIRVAAMVCADVSFTYVVAEDRLGGSLRVVSAPPVCGGAGGRCEYEWRDAPLPSGDDASDMIITSSSSDLNKQQPQPPPHWSYIVYAIDGAPVYRTRAVLSRDNRVPYHHYISFVGSQFVTITLEPSHAPEES